MGWGVVFAEDFLAAAVRFVLVVLCERYAGREGRKKKQLTRHTPFPHHSYSPPPSASPYYSSSYSLLSQQQKQKQQT